MKFEIQINNDFAQELLDSFEFGPIVMLEEEHDGSGDIFNLLEALVDKDGGFKFYIYAEEHPPPHFHVKYQGEENSFSIVDGKPLYPNGLQRFFKNVKKWHKKNKKLLIKTWNETRPTNCPVGKVSI